MSAATYRQVDRCARCGERRAQHVYDGRYSRANPRAYLCRYAAPGWTRMRGAGAAPVSRADRHARRPPRDARVLVRCERKVFVAMYRHSALAERWMWFKVERVRRA